LSGFRPRIRRLVSIIKKADKEFHVIGELAVAPFSLLNNILRELKRAITAGGSRFVYIMEVVQGFLLRASSSLNAPDVR
jgi:hypothetical protein